MKPALALAVALLAGCSAVDVGPEMKLLSDATAGTSKAALAIANNDPAGERGRRLDLAAGAATPEPWIFRGACGPVPRPGDSPGACDLDRGAAWNTTLPPDAARRKILAIQTYVAALSAIANAEADTALLAAQSAALKALGDLASTTEAEGLMATVAELQARQPVRAQALSFALANRRARILKQTVLDHDADFRAVIDETIDLVSDQPGQAEVLEARYTEMNDALTEAVVAGAAGASDYRDALDRADRAHAAYMEARGKSVAGQLAALGAAHAALAERLRRPASIEEIEKFTKTLADLKVAIEAQE